MAVRSLRDDQVEALQAWLAEAVPIMRLSHWVLTAKPLPPGEGGVDSETFAGSFIHDNSDTASVHLGDKFWEQDEAGQRETLTHELLHCHFYRVRTFTGDRLRKQDQETANQMEEIVIEQLSRIIAPLLPMPSIPGPD